MRPVLRPILAILFAALLALTGQSMAIARGSAPVVGEITLCTGSGPVMMPVDAKGNPTGPAHYCPEGAIALWNLEMPAAIVVARMLDWRNGRYVPLHAISATPVEIAEPQARGPPARA